MRIPDLLAELKRRRVIRVLGAYLVAAFILLQVADLVVEPLGLPAWTMTLLIVLLALGLVLAVALSWAFDVEREGVRRAEPAPSAFRPPLLTVLVLLAAAATGYTVLRDDVPIRGPAAIRSIAVLPLANTSGDPANEYFSDGITDELMNALSRLDGLRVAARTSSFQYKGRSVDVREVGSTLGVEAVLEGSVRRSGDRARIHVQLVRADSGYQLWSESYDRELADVFAVQDEIARAVVHALRLRVSGHAAGGGRRTADPEAHALYLKGRFAAEQRSSASIRQAVDYYEQAIARDPAYAVAYAGLGDVYRLQIAYDTVPAAAGFARARAALDRALALDSTLAEAHASRAALLDDEHDWAGAGAAYRRAIRLNPSYATAHHWYALHLATVGRMDAALREIAEAERLDPLSAVIQAAAGVLHRYAGNVDTAVEHFKEAVALAPGSRSFRSHLALGLAQAGRFDEALEPARAAAANGEPLPFAASVLARVHATAGQADSARAILSELEPRRQGIPISFYVGAAYAALGDLDAAFNSFDRTDWTSTSVLALVADPLLGEPLRQDPRYRRLRARLGLEPG